MVFCDTSTLAKYYVREADSPAVREHLDAASGVMLSDLARPELMAVFHRRLREGRWSRKAFEVTVRQFQQDQRCGFWTWASLDSKTTAEAAEVFLILPETVYLRTADCLHLVTARREGFKSILTHDRHQSEAAASFGLNAIRIGEPPQI